MRKYYLFLVLLLLINCSKPQKEETVKIEKKIAENDFQPPEREQRADTTKEKNYIAIFDEKTEKTATLSVHELKIVNQNLTNAIEEYNNSLNNRIKQWNKENKNDIRNFDEEKIDLRYYFRQYFVSINEKSEKIVTVSCLCSCSGERWRDGRILVNDGGDCYLHLTVNITRNKRNKLTHNGDA